jgi:hypothetical protein
MEPLQVMPDREPAGSRFVQWLRDKPMRTADDINDIVKRHAREGLSPFADPCWIG